MLNKGVMGFLPSLDLHSKVKINVVSELIRTIFLRGIFNIILSSGQLVRLSNYTSEHTYSK